jgi:hypothetical protein
MRRTPFAGLALAVALLASASSHAQVVQTQDGKAMPDWAGVWTMMGNTVFDQATKTPANGVAGLAGTRESVPYNDEWAKKYEANIALVAQDRWPDPQTNCGIVSGFPRALNVPDTYEFVVRPEESWILTENGPNVVRIYTDGRKHLAPDDVWPTFTGDSVGHWEGDTLVFDTIGLQGWPHTIVDRTGAIHSDELHVVTRMRRLDANTMEADMVLTDPVAFKAPWHVVKHYRKLAQGTHIYDYACAENNRNRLSPSGRTLTLGSNGKVIDKDQK